MVQNGRAIFYLVLGIAVFSVQDLILKLLSGDYPLHQAMVARSLTAVPFMLVLVYYFDGTLRTLISPAWPLMLLRGLLNFFAYTAYYMGLAALPMATTVALFFTAPLFITILSVLILRETVALPRWLAVFVGFVGVVLMMQPEAGSFNAVALLPIFCGLSYAGLMIMARVMGNRASGAAMAFWGNLAFLVCALALSLMFGWNDSAPNASPSLAFLLRGWVWPTGYDLFLMCACGAIAAFGLTLLTLAYTIGQSSTVAPFEFTFAFWGLLWGWLVWRELPNALGWVGIALIVGAGIYVLRTKEKAAP
jgi:drug/metabolite transporter (DMT)-like permease